MELVYFKRIPEIEKLIENIEEVLKEGNVEVYASAGTVEHWLNSLEMCLKTRGFMIWGQRLDVNDLAQFFKERRHTEEGRSKVQRPFFENYFAKPLINLFYVKDIGFIGAGFITTLIIDVYNLFWDEEFKENSIIFPLRWISKVFWLKPSVLENPKNISRWEGETIDEIKPPRCGLHRISKDKPKVLEFLLEKIEEINYTIEKLGIKKPRPKLSLNQMVSTIRKELYIDENIIKSLYISTELSNVILVGPPGTGKTALAKLICKLKGFEPMVVVANAHWSRFDVIGGLVISERGVMWKSGYLIRALVRHFKNKEEANGFEGTWLIIDEINRADVDKAFSEFFTIFSGINPSEWIIPLSLIEEIGEYVKQDKADYFAKEFLEYLEKYKETLFTDHGYRVPEDFRVIATMNYVDVRNLFFLGEAFARRFIKVEVDFPSNIDEELKFLLDRAIRIINNRVPNVVVNEYLKQFDKILPKISSFVKESRKHRIPLGPAMILQALCLSIIEYSQKPEENILETLARAFNSVSPMAKYWDTELKEILDTLIEKFLK